MKADKTVWAHLALLAVALLYGANYSIAKIAMAGNIIPPLAFIVIRIVGAGIVFTILHQFLIGERVDPKDYPRFALCAFFGAGFNLMMFFKGLQITGAINASLITTMVPILVLIISAILIKEKITPQKVVGILLGAAGAVALILYGKQTGINNPWGDFMIFLNALSFAVYLVLIKTLAIKYHPFTIIRWIFSLGVFIVLPFGWTDLQAIAWASLSPQIWAVIAYVVIGATVLTYLFNVIALRIVNPSVVSIYIYLQPLIAAMIAIGLGNETLSWTRVTAGLMIFAGVFLVSRK